IRKVYWNRLLKGSPLDGQRGPAEMNHTPPRSGDDGKEQFDRAVESKRAELRKTNPNLTLEKARTILQENDTAEDHEAVLLELNSSPAAEKEAEHLLAQFTGIVPDNPRVMKRMVTLSHCVKRSAC